MKTVQTIGNQLVVKVFVFLILTFSLISWNTTWSQISLPKYSPAQNTESYLQDFNVFLTQDFLFNNSGQQEKIDIPLFWAFEEESFECEYFPEYPSICIILV